MGGVVSIVRAVQGYLDECRSKFVVSAAGSVNGVARTFFSAALR